MRARVGHRRRARMAGRSFVRARERLVRSALLRPPRSVAVIHGYPISRFSVAPHALTLTRGTPRSHRVGFPVTRPGARQGPHDRMAGGRGQGRRAWTLLAARPRPAAFSRCPVRADAHLLRSPRQHAPAGFRPGSLPADRPRSCRLTIATSPRAFRHPFRREPSGCASPPSLRARLPMRCPGFGAPALPSARDFGPLRLLAVASGPRHLRI
jgi:hypothetical protein